MRLRQTNIFSKNKNFGWTDGTKQGSLWRRPSSMTCPTNECPFYFKDEIKKNFKLKRIWIEKKLNQNVQENYLREDAIPH
jgi:hypothetical protein